VPGLAPGSADNGREPKVQPVTLRYGWADGTPMTAAERRAVAWIGDDEMWPHLCQLAIMSTRHGGLVADVWFETPVAGRDRKAIARACEAAISARLAS
jgi:lyso-ornithine lipid O-acyltransferase